MAHGQCPSLPSSRPYGYSEYLAASVSRTFTHRVFLREHRPTTETRRDERCARRRALDSAKGQSDVLLFMKSTYIPRIPQDKSASRSASSLRANERLPLRGGLGCMPAVSQDQHSARTTADGRASRTRLDARWAHCAGLARPPKGTRREVGALHIRTQLAHPPGVPRSGRTLLCCSPSVLACLVRQPAHQRRGGFYSPHLSQVRRRLCLVPGTHE